MHANKHPSLTVFERSKDRLDLQVLDLTKGLAIIGCFLVFILLGAWFVFSEKMFLAVSCFFIAFHCVTAFIFLVGVKHLVADVVDDSLSVTYRAVLRRKEIDIRLSDIKQFVLVDPDGNETHRISNTDAEEPEPRKMYIIKARFDDRNPVVLFTRAGALGYDVGHIMLGWWNEHGRGTRL